MASKVKCTCGWSWNKSDSSKKDMYVCHECGRDNSNNMQNGGWLDNYNDYEVSAPEGFQGDGYSNVGRNSSPTWGGQFQMGGSVYPVNYVPKAQPGTEIVSESTSVYKKPFNKQELKNIIKDETERTRTGNIKNPRAEANKIEKSLPTKETVDFFNKIKKELGPEYFTALLKVQNKRGNPSVNVGTDKGLPFHARRNYNPFTNEVNIPKGLENSYDNADDYLTEVSHASQPLSEVIPRFLTNDVPGYIKSYLSSGDIEDNIEKNVYNNPNTVENYTHNKIQPSLIDQIENYTSWPKSKEEEEEEYKLIEDQLKRGNKNLQMGGNIPGATGFSYARTGNIPSEGKYAKKTMASAQNGQEMQYYREGLDWQPKTISRDGAWLDQYDIAQEGINLPSVRDLINDTMNRKIQTRKGKGKETTITKKDNTRTVTPKIGKVATAKEKEQRAIEENKQAQEASELQARKDWVQESMEEAYKSPLMSPGYFTPEGVAIGALQGATKLGPDLYEGNYKGAAIDALMALPIGIPAAKTLGKVLGPEEGLIGKVSQEVNINRNLSKIKKEGQLQGLSDYEIAKKQMEKVGITSNQRKAYTPGISEFAEKYITPRGYQSSDFGTKFSEIINNIKNGGYSVENELSPRLDAWKLYLGKPQVNNTFSLADTAPVLHPSYKSGSLKGMDIYNINKEGTTYIPPDPPDFVTYNDQHLKFLENPISIARDTNIMGGYNRVLTKEGTQYNDIWDLEPTVMLKSLVPSKVGRSPMLEKLFWEKTPTGVMSPKGINVPISKVFGKPFMSHGNLPYTSTDHVNTIKFDINKQLNHLNSTLTPEELLNYKNFSRYEEALKDLENYPKFKKGGIIKDDRGQWGEHKGEPTRINQSEPGSYIDMGPDPLTGEPLTEPLLGISDKGEKKMMYPGEKHKFKKGTKYVDEYPKGKLAKNGLRQEQKGLQNLDNLTNFTNYNKPQSGGWLNKYN
jgi:hypothetical protein